jgi:hypothetical protein
MSEQRNRHLTNQVSQEAVERELRTLGYEVGLTSDKTPKIHRVRSPNDESFEVVVTGLYRPNYWQVDREKPRNGLFYVLGKIVFS